MIIERRLAELGMVLPAPIRLPAGVELPFPWVRVTPGRAFVSGHGPLSPDGSLAGPFGMINTAPGFTATPGVINGFSDVVLEVWGSDRGDHARSAVGVAELPFGIPVEIEAEVLID